MIASMMFACTSQEEQANVKMDYTLDWQTDHLHVSSACRYLRTLWGNKLHGNGSVEERRL